MGICNPKENAEGLVAGTGDPGANGFVMDGLTCSKKEDDLVVKEKLKGVAWPKGLSVDAFILSRKEVPLDETDPNFEKGIADDLFGSVAVDDPAVIWTKGLLLETGTRFKNSVVLDEMGESFCCFVANGLLADGFTGLTKDCGGGIGLKSMVKDDLP